MSDDFTTIDFRPADGWNTVYLDESDTWCRFNAAPEGAHMCTCGKPRSHEVHVGTFKLPMPGWLIQEASDGTRRVVAAELDDQEGCLMPLNMGPMSNTWYVAGPNQASRDIEDAIAEIKHRNELRQMMWARAERRPTIAA